MPSQVFVGLTDEDLGRIIGFLKSLPVVAGPGPSISVGPVGRAGLAIGKLKLAAQLIAETVPPPEVPTKEAAYGRHVARTTCAQCHGTDLRSEPGFASPDLRVVVAASSPEAFSQMLRTGVGPDGRNLGGMSAWARNNLSHLTDSEIAAVYSYLRSMPESVRN